MLKIIRGTTPTITFTDLSIDLNDFEKVFVTIRQASLKRTIVVEKSIDECIIGEDYIAINLSQDETLSFLPDAQGNIQLNVLTKSGLRFASDKVKICFDDNLKGEKI